MKPARFTKILLVVSLVLVWGSAAYSGKVIKQADLNPFEPFDITTSATCAVFKKEVESRTNGDIEVKLYPSGILGKERETIEQLQRGITQSYIASMGGISPFYPVIDILNTPFLFANIEDSYEFYRSDFVRDLKEDIRKKTGLYVLGFIPNGFFQFTNSTRPIKTPADMKGLKMRTMTIPLHMEFMKSLGASPTPIAWAEIYTSLQTKVVDGQHNPVPVIKLGKLYEVQKYLTISNHMPAVYVWVMSDKWLSSLSAEEQDIIKRSARVAIAAGKGLDRIIVSSEKGLPFLGKNMEIYNLSTSQKDMFRKASQGKMEKFFGESLGEEGMKWYRRMIEAAKASSAAP